MCILLLGLAEAAGRNCPLLDRVAGNFLACIASQVAGSLHAMIEVLISMWKC